MRRCGMTLAGALASLVLVMCLLCLVEPSVPTRQIAVAGQAPSTVPEQSTTGPTPPLEVAAKVTTVSTSMGSASEKTLPVPGYLWRHGCGPTAVGMVIGYYDLGGYPELIPGEASTQTEYVNQAIASRRSSANPGHYEDYSLPMDSSSPSILLDKSEPPAGDEHTSDCIADFMKTSWSSVGNRYGWSWGSAIGPAFVSYVNTRNPSYYPSCQTYYKNSTLTWEVLTSEINNSRPMVFLVDSDADGSTDHFVTVVGYRDTPTLQYGCLDTWEPAGVIRWCSFAQMTSGQSFGVYSGYSFALTTRPTVTTGNPSALTTNSARLNGDLTSLGTASSVNVSFEWGLTTSYDNQTPAVSRNTTGDFSANLTGLAPNTTYHFRSKAVGGGTSYGTDRSFTTPPLLRTITVNTSSLVSDYAATVHYVQAGVRKTATTYGTWSGDVDNGSMVSIDNTVAVSSTERYSTNAATSWAANQTATYTVPYYHQFKPAISVAAAGTGHTDLGVTNSATLTYRRFGSAGTFNVFDGQGYYDWADLGSTATLSNTSSASTSTHRWYASGTASWVVNDAGSKSAMYWEQFRVTVVPAGLGTSHPANLQVAQNGLSMNATASTSWSDWADIGSTLGITNPVVVSGTERYSTTDATSWTVSQTAMYTVDYARQYYLTVQSERGNPQGTGWHDQGSTVQFSVDSTVEESDGIRSVFVSWSGDSGANSASTVMDGPKTVTAAWKEQCQLIVSVVPSNATTASGSGWYDKGQNVALVVPDAVLSVGSIRYVFVDWNVDGTQVAGRNIAVEVDAPQLAEAAYITQYHLEVQSVRGNPQGTGWYDSGSEAAVSVESPIGTIVRQVFAGWDGESSADTPDGPVIMNGAKTLVAKWRTDYTQLYILIAGVLAIALGIIAVIILVIRRRHARLQMEQPGRDA